MDSRGMNEFIRIKRGIPEDEKYRLVESMADTIKCMGCGGEMSKWMYNYESIQTLYKCTNRRCLRREWVPYEPWGINNE